MTVTIYPGDALQVPKTLDAESVQCCVTSPPYWGLRDYGIDGQLGLEKTPGEYVEHLVAIFREVRRVLRDDGCLWLNLGDSYASGSGGDKNIGDPNNPKAGNGPKSMYKSRKREPVPGLKPKDLVGIPWRVAFALQQDGWYLRSDVIWSKPNPMPESVTDRPTKAHEYLFLLTKSLRYYYDAEAVKEPAADYERKGGTAPYTANGSATHGIGSNSLHQMAANGRNLRSVWTIATTPYKGAHFATFPPALVEPCIKAGTSEKGRCPVCGKAWERVVEHQAGDTEAQNRPKRTAGMDSKTSTLSLSGNGSKEWAERGARVTTTGWQPGCTCGADPVPCVVLDPFGGAGTVGLVADRLQRDCILIELNPEYCQMAADRIKADGGFMADVVIK